MSTRLLCVCMAPVSTSWHTAEDVFRGPPIDRSILPTAPRAAREPNVDRSRLPKSPPYTAFLGNLPYDVSEESIKDFFRGLAVRSESTVNLIWKPYFRRCMFCLLAVAQCSIKLANTSSYVPWEAHRDRVLFGSIDVLKHGHTMPSTICKETELTPSLRVFS